MIETWTIRSTLGEPEECDLTGDESRCGWQESALDVFFAGDSVALLRPATLDAGRGIGTGGLREHVDALLAGGATFYASGLSSKARGLDASDLGGIAVTMAPPTRLVELAFEADRVLTY